MRSSSPNSFSAFSVTPLRCQSYRGFANPTGESWSSTRLTVLVSQGEAAEALQSRGSAGR